MNEQQLAKYLESLIHAFDTYADSLILDYEKNKYKVVKQILNTTDEEIEKFISKFEEKINNFTKVKNVFVPKDVNNTFITLIRNYNGKGVRITSKGEKLILTTAILKHLKTISEKNININDVIVLSALISDLLYAGWLYKEGFIDKSQLSKYVNNLLKEALSTADNPLWVREKALEYLIPTWAGLEERTSIVETLANKDLEQKSIELAKKLTFGSEENFDKTVDIFITTLKKYTKEKPKEPVKWVEKEIQEIYEESKLIEPKQNQYTKKDIFIEATKWGILETGISYLEKIDKVIEESNKQIGAIAKYAGSRGAHGFFAEEWHAATFNIDAVTKGKPYYAETLQNTTANSVDLVIKSTNTGQIIRKYQAKYYATPTDTVQALEKGDYRGQRPLVPSEQLEEVNKLRATKYHSPASDTIEYDGVRSKPLSLDEAKKLTEEIKQRNNIFSTDNVSFKESTKQTFKYAAKTFTLILALKGGLKLGKVFLDKARGKDVSIYETLQELKKESPKMAKEALISTLKITLVKATKRHLLKNASPTVIAAIVEGGFRVANEFKKWRNREITVYEFIINSVKEVSKSAGGIFGATQGFAIGASLGSIIPIFGTFVGGVIGAIVGGIIGEKSVEYYFEGRLELANPFYTGISMTTAGVFPEILTKSKSINEKVKTAVSKVKNFFSQKKNSMQKLKNFLFM